MLQAAGVQVPFRVPEGEEDAGAVFRCFGGVHFEADSGFFAHGAEPGLALQERVELPGTGIFRCLRVRGGGNIPAFAFRLRQRDGRHGDRDFRRADPVGPADHAELGAGDEQADAQRQRDGRDGEAPERDSFLCFGTLLQLFGDHRAHGGHGIDAGQALVQRFTDQLIPLLFIHFRSLLPA